MPNVPPPDPDFVAFVQKSLAAWTMSLGVDTSAIKTKNLLKQLEPFAGKELRLFCVPPGTTVKGILKKAEDGYVQLEETIEADTDPDPTTQLITISIIKIRRCVPFESIKMIEGEFYRKEVAPWPLKSKTDGEA